MSEAAYEKLVEVTATWPGSCFACSNPAGLNLCFRYLPAGVVTRCQVPPMYCGFDGLVHGGIITTLLDEVSCWAIFASLGRLGVTQEMTTRFVKPVPTSTELALEGKIVDHTHRTASVRATICNGEGVLLAESVSLWVFPRLSRIAALAGVEEEILQVFLDECRYDSRPSK